MNHCLLKPLIFVVFCWHLTDGWLAAAFSRNSESQNNQHLDIDILEALNISDGMRGVSEIQGSQPQNKAWRLHTAFDHVQIPENNASQLFSKLTDQMTVEFIYKQHRKTVATLLSINSPGKMSPWFRITSNTKLNKLFIFYRIMEDSKLHEKIFNLHDVHRIDNWTKLAVSINGTKLLLNLDCRPPDKQELAGHIYLQFPKDSLIYFRQEPGFKKKLLGAVEVARISSTYEPNFSKWQCLTSIKKGKISQA